MTRLIILHFVLFLESRKVKAMNFASVCNVELGLCRYNFQTTLGN